MYKRMNSIMFMDHSYIEQHDVLATQTNACMYCVLMDAIHVQTQLLSDAHSVTHLPFSGSNAAHAVTVVTHKCEQAVHFHHKRALLAR